MNITDIFKIPLFRNFTQKISYYDAFDLIAEDAGRLP